jgi:uncharacterized OB-fold protein
MADEPSKASKTVRAIETPTRLEYTYTPGRASTRFLRNMERKKIMGQKCTGCGKVYVPPRGACPRCGLPTEEEVEVTDKGTVVSFTVVRVPSDNIALELPYAAGSILLDGADIPFQALLRDVDVADIRMGMRVQAQWVDDSELGPTFQNIQWFHPIDEPDVPFEQFQEHL